LRVAGLQYFTHTVDDHVYGAWFRIVSPTEIEIIGVGLLESATYTGSSPDSAARSVLENFVRQRIRDGIPIPNLDALPPVPVLSPTPREPL
jgi:hypothetical protein